MICQAAIARCKRMHLGRWQSLSQSPLVTLGLWKRRMDLARSETSSRGVQKCVTVNLRGRFLSQRPEQVANTKEQQRFFFFFSPSWIGLKARTVKINYKIKIFLLEQIFIRQKHLRAGESGRMRDPEHTLDFETLETFFAFVVVVAMQTLSWKSFPLQHNKV